jgi:isoleucyl-tRNA synthetase
MMANEKTDYKNTLTLPQTEFPMRASLASREPERLAHWEAQDLYGRIIAKNQKSGKSPFVLHDGPPFANGSAHTGHMTNRNLKDIILRYKSMQGHACPFFPGWDCHGLPTELKALKELKDGGKTLGAVEIREKCREFSLRNMDALRKQFKRLGIAADWSREYRTMDPSFEAEELRSFACFVEKGLVYRDKKPVIWSIPCRTALAEAEIEYKEYVSPSIWVAFQSQKEADLYFIIWTTTPWTIPANVGVALNPNLDYVEILASGKRLIVADSLYEKTVETLKLEGASRGKVCKGREFEGMMLKHPFMAHASKVVLADYVSAEDGTGCVHTAPGHGMDDYVTGREQGLEIYSPLDDNGCYIDDGRIPADLVGLSTLDKDGHCEANDAVIAKLNSLGCLLARKAISHQYPFCWRSHTPIVFRSVEQWFVGLDKGGMRQKVIENIDTVRWVPERSINRIRGSVESRPDWCISRQRAWGLPIPAFYDATGKRYIDAGVIRGLAEKVAADPSGSDIFFKWSAEELLKGIALPKGWNPAELKPETDTLDVWFDSATSNRAALMGKPDVHWPADMYLEGPDQHRGWFQSSLWLSTVVEGKAPYKTVLTHGWILDTDREKLSKSKGSASFDELVAKYGADVLRLWNASQDYTVDITIGDDILDQAANAYRGIRNTLRFELSNLFDFDASKAVALDELEPIDAWVLNETAKLIVETTSAYESYNFAAAYRAIMQFVQVTLSSTYHDCLKDRLYTWSKSSKARRSSQTVIALTFDALVRMLAPILPFTSDEAWAYRTEGVALAKSSVHEQLFPTVPEEWGVVQKTAEEVGAIMALKAKANESMEELRAAKTIGQSLEAELIFSGDVALLKKYEEALPEIFIVSKVTLEPSEGELRVRAQKAPGRKCPRCWRFVEDFEGDTCSRCAQALRDA